MNGEINYTNLGVKELPKETYYNVSYFGLIRDENNEYLEVYLAHKEDKEVFVLISFEKPISECKKTKLELRTKKGEVVDNITIISGKKIVRSEFSKGNNSKDMNSVIFNILRNNEKSLDERIAEAKAELASRRMVLS